MRTKTIHFLVVLAFILNNFSVSNSYNPDTVQHLIRFCCFPTILSIILLWWRTIYSYLSEFCRELWLKENFRLWKLELLQKAMNNESKVQEEVTNERQDCRFRTLVLRNCFMTC